MLFANRVFAVKRIIDFTTLNYSIVSLENLRSLCSILSSMYRLLLDTGRPSGKGEKYTI